MTFRRTLIRHVTSTSSTTRDPTKSNGPPFRYSNRRRHQYLRSKLRHVNRVHAPETDMRPLLPHRDLFLKSLQKGISLSRDAHPSKVKPRAQSRPRRGLGELADAAWASGKAGDMGAIERVIDRLVYHPLPTKDRSRWHRAVILNIINSITSSMSSSNSESQDEDVHLSSTNTTVDDVMGVLTSRSMLDGLDTGDVGAVLDALVRHKLSQGEDVAAIRGELMSRALETRLSARTYAQLLDRMHRLDGALSLLHRAVAVGVEPSTQMLNRILELCFAVGDGERAKRVVADMARRSLRPNHRTLASLLAQAEGFDGVDAVFSVVRRAARSPSPSSALLFLNAYANVVVAAFADKTEHEDLNSFGSRGGNGRTQIYAEYVARCFSVIDWFFDEAGVGVPRVTLNSLVEHFAREGLVEASLRTWREMRRSWLGDPDLRSRAALYAALSRRKAARTKIHEKEENGDDDDQVNVIESTSAEDYKNVSTNERDETLQRRLLRGISENEVSKVKRLALRELDDFDLDMCVLEREDMSSSSLKDKATVLHRWARIGRVHTVREWIEKEIDRNVVFGGIDVRLLLPLLSDRGPTRIDSLKLLLEYLRNGETVAGPKQEVVRRVTDRVWLWVLTELDESNDHDFEHEEHDDPYQHENSSGIAADASTGIGENSVEPEQQRTEPPVQDVLDIRTNDSHGYRGLDRHDRSPIRSLSAKDIMFFLREFAGTEVDIDELSERYELDDEEIELLRITSALLGDLDNVVRVFGEGDQEDGGKRTE